MHFDGTAHQMDALGDLTAANPRTIGGFLASHEEPTNNCEHLLAIANYESATTDRASDELEAPDVVVLPAVDDEAACVDEDSPRDGLRMLAISVISLAVKEDRSWFFAARTQEIFKFWASVARLNPDWVRRHIGTREPGNKEEAHCPGLSLRGQTWWLVVYDRRQRHRVKLGRGITRKEAAELARGHREAIKANREG